MSQNLAQVIVESSQPPLGLVPTQTYYLASTWRRLAALTIDGALLSLLWIPAMSFQNIQRGELRLSPVLSAIALISGALYSPLMLKCFSRTLGKMTLGLYVVDNDSGVAKLTWNQVLSRTIPQLVTFFVANALLSYALMRKDRRHAFDLLADTRVVQTTPRASAPSERWIIGVWAILFYGLTGLHSFVGTVRSFLTNCPELRFDNGSLIYRVNPDRTCK